MPKKNLKNAIPILLKNENGECVGHVILSKKEQKYFIEHYLKYREIIKFFTIIYVPYVGGGELLKIILY